MKFTHLLPSWVWAFSLFSISVGTVSATPMVTLSLEEAINRAQTHDLWLAQSRYQQSSYESQAAFNSALPDPKVSVAMANLPTDSFDFEQEPMTQLKVGISQMFPRGDSLAIKQKQSELMAEQQVYLRADRSLQLERQVTQLWLDAFKAAKTIQLIERNRSLFTHLVDVAESSYTSALGRTRQQDLVRAQLELTRLDDRLNVLEQQHMIAKSRLGEWLSEDYLYADRFQLADDMPKLLLQSTSLNGNSNADVILQKDLSHHNLSQHLQQHPAVKSIEFQITVADQKVRLAEQKYRPQWGLNASYGYRGDDAMGDDRADFMSVGVTFDLPLFTEQKQDKEVQSAVANTQRMKTQKWLKVRTMMSEYQAQNARLEGLKQRAKLYQQQLLTQMNEQSEAALTAYTHDDGLFSEVVQARIAELNALIDALHIDIDTAKTIAAMNYFLPAPKQGETL